MPLPTRLHVPPPRYGLRIRDDAIVHRGLPARLEIGRLRPPWPVFTPVSTDDLIPRRDALPCECGEQLMRRAPLIERRDQRLHDRRGAVEGPRIAPRLQIMRLGQMPVALPRGLVLVQAEADAQRHALHPFLKA